MQVVYFGMGCFWGAERLFWLQQGVYSTAVGYQGGYTKNPTYEEVCSAKTAHTEVVQVVYDPAVISFAQLLELFWKWHNPTEYMKQDIDIGTQYRSAIYTLTEEHLNEALASRDAHQQTIEGQICTEIKQDAGPFYYAEDYHQQYLHKNPDGECHIHY